MSRATVTSKGQVTIPASTRRAAGLEPGDQVLFLVEGGRITLIPMPARRLTQLKGALASDAGTTTLGGNVRETTARALGESMAEEMRDWCEHS
ncbi:MAG: AbrB/MazE/SpoVT family DNA-binding domain-containing protein [Anaerolineae bacterium]